MEFSVDGNKRKNLRQILMDRSEKVILTNMEGINAFIKETFNYLKSITNRWNLVRSDGNDRNVRNDVPNIDPSVIENIMV